MKRKIWRLLHRATFNSSRLSSEGRVLQMKLWRGIPIINKCMMMIIG